MFFKRSRQKTSEGHPPGWSCLPSVLLVAERMVSVLTVAQRTFVVSIGPHYIQLSWASANALSLGLKSVLAQPPASTLRGKNRDAPTNQRNPSDAMRFPQPNENPYKCLQSFSQEGRHAWAVSTGRGQHLSSINHPRPQQKHTQLTRL